MVLKLELGKKYENRRGDIVEIIDYIEGNNCPYVGDDGNTFHECGLCLIGASVAKDLVAEVLPSQNLAEDGTVKPAVEEIPSEILLDLGTIFGFGAEKYYSGKWIKEPTSIKKRIGSALRHVYKYRSGTKLDDESGLNHLDHAIVQLMMASYYDKKGITND